MQPVESNINGKQAVYGDIKEKLEQEGFVLGDNWDYQSGFFDGVLNEEYDSTLFLRIPFEVIEGVLDEENAVLRAKQPFILKHQIKTDYSEGHTENPTYDPLQAGYLVNQFQEPQDKDDQIENLEYWVTQAQHSLTKIEYLFR